MLLIEYATNKKAQKFVGFLCQKYSLNTSLNAQDIQSLAHEYISIQISRNRELVDEKHFFNTLRQITLNSTKDLLVKNYNRYEVSEAPDQLPEPIGSVEVDHDARDLLRLIDKAIRAKFANFANVLIAYEHCILMGRKMESVSNEFKISLGTIKTNMRMVRSFANQQLLKLN